MQVNAEPAVAENRVSADQTRCGIWSVQPHTWASVECDHIAIPGRGSTNGLRSGIHFNAGGGVVEIQHTSCVRANVIADDLIGGCPGSCDHDAGPAVAADEIAGFRHRPADDVIFRSIQLNAVAGIPQCGRAGDVGADEVAFNGRIGRLDKMTNDIHQIDAVAHIPRDDVSGLGACAADNRSIDVVSGVDSDRSVTNRCSAGGIGADQIALNGSRTANQVNAVCVTAAQVAGPCPRRASQATDEATDGPALLDADTVTKSYAPCGVGADIVAFDDGVRAGKIDAGASPRDDVPFSDRGTANASGRTGIGDAISVADRARIVCLQADVVCSDRRMVSAVDGDTEQ